jgi:hypothetical protein
MQKKHLSRIAFVHSRRLAATRRLRVAERELHAPIGRFALCSEYSASRLTNWLLHTFRIARYCG